MRHGGMEASVTPAAAFVVNEGGTPPPVVANVAFSRFVHRGSGGAGSAYYYVGAAAGGMEVSTVTPAVNTLYAFPFVIGSDRTADEMSISVVVSGGAGSQFRFGFYNNLSDTAPYPTSLIVDSGVRDGTVTGFHSVSITVTFTPGLYWGAFVCGTGAPQMQGLNGNVYHSILGSEVGTDVDFRGVFIAFPFAALPASFPAGAALAATGQSANTVVPDGHRLRYSA